MSILDRVILRAKPFDQKGWLWRDITVRELIAFGSLLLGLALLVLSVCLAILAFPRS